MNPSIKKITALIIFSIAMALLESAVVVYLRALYYPEGFGFPLKNMDQVLMITELAREFATIIMLIGIGYLFGHNVSTRFAGFLLAFAVWDIFYYVFLYLLIQWPLSLNDWDILFLLPVPWYGPVWAPVVISLFMIAYATLILHAHTQAFPIRAGFIENLLISSGVLLTLFTMTTDAFYLMRHGINVEQVALMHVPSTFNNEVFILSCLLYLTAGFIYFRKIRSRNQVIISAMF